LKEYLTINNNELDIEYIKEIGLQILNALEFIHDKKYVYIDMKPENIMTIIENNNIIKIIDFGLAEKYILLNQHRENLKKKGFSGTPLYSSISVMQGYTSSRRDDIESLGYLLLYLIRGGILPWNQMSIQDIFVCKLNYDFCEKKENIAREIVLYARNLEYEIKPDYELLRQILNTNNSKFCRAKTKKGKPCKNLSKINGFCHLHK